MDPISGPTSHRGVCIRGVTCAAEHLPSVNMKENSWVIVRRRPFTMSASEKALQLRSLIRLLTDASEIVIAEWEAEERQGGNREHTLPSRKLYDARRVIRGACDMCADLVQDPLNRLEEMSHGALSLMESLYILVATGIPDILDEVDSRHGMSIHELSHKTGINDQKLGTPSILSLLNIASLSTM